jgi:uncharacterized BrkB/YihY/UPF0761 family membrane protein
MKLIPILFSLFGIVVGLFIFFNPSQAIEIQRRFYEKINWRIEPISMQKEISNTKIMGIFLFILSVITLIFTISLAPK